MSDPAEQRPVPGPPRYGPGRKAAQPEDGGSAVVAHATAPVALRFAGLAERPVAEHVAVYEAEHQRLQGELSTIDQL